jgi:hypothetical protein
VLESGSEASYVCDHTTTHDEHWFVACHSVVFEFNEYLLNIGHVFAGFITVVNQLDAFDAKVLELSVQFITLVHDNLVANDCYATSKRLIDVRKESVRGLEDVVSDFDRSCQSSGHNRLDCLRVLGGKSKSIAMTLDAGWHDCMRVDCLEVDIILYLLGLVA